MSASVIDREPLARYTGWKIGGPARFFASAASGDDLIELVAWGYEHDLPIFMLGGGTNILLGDAGFGGLVIRNRATSYQVDERGDDILLHIDSGAPTAGTARRMANAGFGGLVWAEGLPGTIGGAIYGNAGCYGGDTAGNLVRATVLTPEGEVEEWDLERFAFRYRGSALKSQGAAGGGPPVAQVGLAAPVVLRATLRLERDDPEKLAAQIAAIAAERRGKTPSGSSCGSSFKNPPGATAGKLLDQAGLKGARVGAAVVSERHANYIVNEGGATAADVLRLMELMRERVLQTFGVELEPEVQVVGEL